MDRNEIEKNKIMTNANIVRNEFKLLSKIGFSKQPYKNLTNQQLLGYNFTKDQFGALKMENNRHYNGQKSLSKTITSASRKNI